MVTTPNLYRGGYSLPPNPAASQALMELGEKLPGAAHLPVDQKAAAKLSAHWAERVAGESTDVDVLTHLAKSNRRFGVAMALLKNPALPEDLVPVAAGRLAKSRGRALWVEAYDTLPRPRLDALFDAVDDLPKAFDPEKLWGLVVQGYIRAARVLEACGTEPDLRWVSVPHSLVDDSAAQRLHEAGLHKWAVMMLEWWYGLGPGGPSNPMPEPAVRAALESAIITGEELEGFASRRIKVPEDMIRRLADSNHAFVMRCGYDLPEDWVIENAALLLDTGWPTWGRWASMTSWTPEVKEAVLAALRDAPADKVAGRVRFLAARLQEGDIKAELPGVDEVPISTWAHLGIFAKPLTWWLKYSAGRVRTADEALAFLEGVAWDTKLTHRLRVFIADAPEEWSDEDRARVTAHFDQFGDYTSAVEAFPDLAGPGAILGDNVAAWKLFYSAATSAGPAASPMDLARTAVELVGP